MSVCYEIPQTSTILHVTIQLRTHVHTSFFTLFIHTLTLFTYTFRTLQCYIVHLLAVVVVITMFVTICHYLTRFRTGDRILTHEQITMPIAKAAQTVNSANAISD